MRAIVDVVLPVFGLIFAGVAAGRFRILGQESSQALNGFVYWFALPPLLFLGMARVPVAQAMNGPFILAYLGGVVVVFAAIAIVWRWMFPGNASELSMAAMNGTFANTGYMGIPLFMTAYGPEGMLPAVISAVINGAVVTGGVIVLVELAQGAGQRFGRVLADVGHALVTNPLVLAPLAGLAFSASGLSLPKPIATFGDLLAASAGPCALFAVGLFIASRPLATLVRGGKAVESAWLVAIKLIVHPLATWLIAVALEMDAFWTASAVILAALPTGALAFVVAQQYRVYVERTSAVILASTVLSLITLSAVVVLFGDARP
jgi:malonate transporter and related proteins